MHSSSLLTGSLLCGCIAFATAVFPTAASASYAYPYSYQPYPMQAFTPSSHPAAYPSYVPAPSLAPYMQQPLLPKTTYTGYAQTYPAYKQSYRPFGILHGDFCGRPIVIPGLARGNEPLQVCMQGFNYPSFIW